jgi:hypothetical protein
MISDFAEKADFLVEKLSVDLIPDSGVQHGGFNPRETSIPRVRAILSHFVKGRLDNIFFFVDLQDQEAVGVGPTRRTATRSCPCC